MKTRWLVIAATALALGIAGSADAGGDVAAGKAKAKSCIGCHGADGKGKKNNPPMVGIPEAEFAQAMNDYKSGTRKHKTMNVLSKKLSDDDIANLAAYYASLK
jgi:cytochrome c553